LLVHDVQIHVQPLLNQCAMCVVQTQPTCVPAVAVSSSPACMTTPLLLHVVFLQTLLLRVFNLLLRGPDQVLGGAACCLWQPALEQGSITRVLRLVINDRPELMCFFYTAS
jgi:hypothetical protein